MKKISRPWRRYGAMAACLAVVLAAAFALERLEDARRWAELEAGFRPADTIESAPDSGGGADTGSLDGAEYWNDSEKRPASSYSLNVEIGELDRNGTESAKRAEGSPAEDETGIAMSSCLAWLEPEEIFAQDTVIFRGTVESRQRYYRIDALGVDYFYRTVVSIKVTDSIRGGLEEGETYSLMYYGAKGYMDVSTSGPLSDLEIGSEGIFMPRMTGPDIGWRGENAYLCYADLAELYLDEGERFVFLDTEDGLRFSRSTYQEIAEAEELDEVADYIRKMIGETEQSRPAAVPAEPQAAPPDTAQADPVLLDPTYGVSGPAGARELPGGAYAGDE